MRTGRPRKSFSQMRACEAEAVQRIADDIVAILKAGSHDEEELRMRLAVARTYRWEAALRVLRPRITISHDGTVSLRGTQSDFRGWDAFRRMKIA